MARSAFGERLKQIFDNATNQQIADKIGTSAPAVQNYVSGRVPDAEKLLLISKITNCNLHWLLTGDGKQFLTDSDEFDIERAIAKHDAWQPILEDWYEFEGQEMPELLGASFMHGWHSFPRELKIAAIEDLKKVLDTHIERQK